MRERASEYFRGADGLNCAQAVMKAFEEVYRITPETIESYAALGGGRAEGGMCGALYGATKLAGGPDVAAKLVDRFVEIVGFSTCREIKKAKKFSCADCVETAAGLVEDQFDESGGSE